MSKRASILPLALAIVFGYGAACSPESRASPRYEGPAPSPAWQTILRGLSGEQLADTKLGSPGDTLVVEAFFISANPVTGLGPIVTLVTPRAIGRPFDVNAPQGSEGRWILPVITDGDAADLVRRVTGSVSAGAPKELGELGETAETAETSAIYRKIIDGH
jgi:hypothetical protein